MSEHLVQIADAAIADAVRRSGPHLACRPGCASCCVGVFAISMLDRDRLREGLIALSHREPARAAAVRERTAQSVARLAPWFPGDAASGVLGEGEQALELFEQFANDEPCPALDPSSQTCDLYAARPMLCRTFGPPMPSGDDGSLAVCELCFVDAAPEEIARCAIDASFVELEDALLVEHEAPGSTLVAFALRGCCAPEEIPANTAQQPG